MKKFVLGVDVGGSRITAQLIDLEKKEVMEGSWCRGNIDTLASAEEVINAWAEIIEKSIGSSAIRPYKISIAMPGPMDYRKGICKIKDQGKYESLYQKNVKELLANRLGVKSVSIQFMNDAACFLKGELFTGSISEFDEAIGLTLGTGLGTSHTVKGSAYDSNLWKMPFMKGIAEDYLSTRWFIKRFAELSGITVKDVKELVDHYKSDPSFALVFSEFSYNLAVFIHKFIRKKMPLAAVIGGNIAQAEEYFMAETRKHLNAMMGYSFPVRRSKLGEKAAILGAGARFAD